MSTKPAEEHGVDVAALALGALAGDERAAMEAHIAACAACRAAYAEACEVAALLGLAAPEATPPPSLGMRIMAQALGERAVYRRPRPWRWLAVAAVLLAVLGWNVALQLQVQAQAQTITALRAQLTTQEAVVHVLAQGTPLARPLAGDAPAPQAHGTIYIDPDGTTGLLVVRDMPPPPAGKVYQLWLIHDGQRASGGLFSVDERGYGVLVIRAPQPLRTYQAVGVTAEPAGGSAGPTSPRVIGGRL
jgi:anti-sigma-K factor RskA